MIADLLFFIFAGILLGAAGTVILARNPMYCILALIAAFFNAAGLFILLGAEFLALLLVMVYVGAVAVMFLFVLMTINIDFAVLKRGMANYLPAGLLVGAVLLAELMIAVWGGLFSTPAAASQPVADNVDNIVQIGQVLFTNYLLPFQMCGLILLTAMVGAIVLTLRQRKDVRRQDVHKQVFTKPSDCVKLKKVKSGEGV